MRVDCSEWYTGRPGLVARKYTYSQMGNFRDVDVHFDIQAGLSTFTFVTFFISDLDLPSEMSLRVSLRPLDDENPQVEMPMLGRPDGASGATLGLANQDSTSQCIALFLEGKDLNFEVDTSDGEKLLQLPLPNDQSFQTAYEGSFEQVRADDAQFASSDGLIGRLNRFMRGLSDN